MKTTEQRRVPSEVALLLREMTVNHEEKTRTANGTMPEVVLHAALVGYYTGIIQTLVLIGYESDDDPVLCGLSDLRKAHSERRWPELPGKEATP